MDDKLQISFTKDISFNKSIHIKQPLFAVNKVRRLGIHPRNVKSLTRPHLIRIIYLSKDSRKLHISNLAFCTHAHKIRRTIYNIYNFELYTIHTMNYIKYF